MQLQIDQEQINIKSKLFSEQQLQAIISNRKLTIPKIKLPHFRNSIENQQQQKVQNQSQDILIDVIPSNNISQQLKKFKQSPISKFELVSEFICIFLFLYTWVYFFIQFNALPQSINTTNNFDHSVSSINKNNFIILIITDAFAYVLSSILQRIPHKFRYKFFYLNNDYNISLQRYFVKLDQNNIQQIFTTTRIFIMSIKIITIIMCLYACISLFNVITQQWDSVALILLVLFSIPYSIAGFIYYKYLSQFSE